MQTRDTSAMASTGTARNGILPLVGHALVAVVALVRARQMPAVRTRSSPSPARALPPTDPRAHRAGTDPRQHEGAAPAGATSWWGLFATAASQWMAHKDARLGAALAYYSVFSLGPLIVIAIAIAGLLFGQDAVRGEVTAGLKGMLGETGAQALEAMLTSASKPAEGVLATVIGLVALIFAAIGVVVQLKDALNTVWDVKAPPGKGLWGFVRAYVLSFAGVLALGFLLLVSMLVTTALAAAGKYLSAYVPEAALQAVSFAVSFLVITALFAMMFKWLPDTKVHWRDVWLGAAITAALFELGKFLIGFYIGKQGLESTYGAAASIVVVLIWVYFSAQIVLFGAEITNVQAKSRAATEPAASP